MKANLIIRPEKIGDLVIATTLVGAFKETFPDQPVHFLADEVTSVLLEKDPRIDKIIRLPWKDRYRGMRPSWPSIWRTLRQAGPYERAAVLYSNVEGWNAVLALNGVRQVAQIGGTVSAKLLGHACVLRKNYPPGRHITDLFLEVAAKLGATASDRAPRLYVTAEEQAAIEDRFPFLREPGGRIFIHPFSISSPTNLSPASYLELARYLAAETGRRVYFLGTRKELEQSGLPADPLISTVLVGQLSLRELMAACTRADIVIGGSSGLIQIAAAVGAPTLGLYCHDAHVWGPLGRRAKTLAVPAAQCRRMGATGAMSGACQAPAFCDLAFALPKETILAEVRQIVAQLPA
jgi:ADP-heptose:LPS heptosyltransferase